MRAIRQQFLCCCCGVKISTSKQASLQIKDENRTCLLGSVLLGLVSSTIQPQGFVLQRNEDIYKNKQIGKQDKQRKKLKRRKIPEYCNATYTTPNGQFLSTYKPLLTPSPTARHDPQCPLVAASNQYLNAALCQREVKQNPFSRVKISCFTLHRVFVAMSKLKMVAGVAFQSTKCSGLNFRKFFQYGIGQHFPEFGKTWWGWPKCSTISIPFSLLSPNFRSIVRITEIQQFSEFPETFSGNFEIYSQLERRSLKKSIA